MRRAALLRPLAFLAILAGLAGGAFAQSSKSAEDYFHGAAYKYVAGKLQEASVEADEGVRAYPDDAKLRDLAEQIRKMKDQQRQDQNPGGGNGQDKNKPDKDKQNGKDPNSQNPQNQDPGKNKDGDGKKDSDKQKGEQTPESDPGKESKEMKAPDNGQARPAPGQMSKDDAERLLNSFSDEEKKEQGQRRQLLKKRLETEQDW